MRKDLYEILALAGRYVFAALMVLIVLRAWRITIVDNRRARRLRLKAPQTGLCGELVVLEGGGKAREGMRYPVIREGIIGSSRKADIRVRHSSVSRIHAYFELTEEGLKLRSHGDALISRNWEDPEGDLLLRDGDTLELGDVQLLLVLTAAQGASRVEAPESGPEADDMFSTRSRTFADDDDDETTLAEDIFGTDEPAPRRERPDRPPQSFRRETNDDDQEDIWL